jgi:hypothetical protein
LKLDQQLAKWFRPAVFLGSNPITLAGAVLTTSSALTLIVFWIFDLIGGGPASPYVGVIFFLILPGVFLIGLVLMPIGALLRRQALRRAGELPETFPRIDFSKPILRRAFGWVGGLTLLNLVILSTATYHGVEYMDSAQFCGQTCHTVMQPEFTAYINSPHQRVACVECHIGPGAGWFARSKLSGVRQVIAVTFHTYDTPIPSPVEQLRPARETCEQCHWPQRFTGDKFIVRSHYADDEKNTHTYTVLLMKIGGHTWQGGVGIHGHHLDQGSRVEYVSTDRQRQNIVDVKFVDPSGKLEEFTNPSSGATPQQIAAGEHRTMDCVDCHNRPTHVFQLPEAAVDQSMSDGQISPDLPFIKKQSVAALRADYPDRDSAAQKIAATLDAFYQSSYPDVYRDKRALVDAAVKEVQAIYLRNIFPQMKVTWGTYPSNLGHLDSPGCFRCHDGSHTSADGRTIPMDCDTCHTLLAVDDPNPKVLTDLAGN